MYIKTKDMIETFRDYVELLKKEEAFDRVNKYIAFVYAQSIFHKKRDEREYYTRIFNDMVNQIADSDRLYFDKLFFYKNIFFDYIEKPICPICIRFKNLKHNGSLGFGDDVLQISNGSVLSLNDDSIIMAIYHRGFDYDVLYEDDPEYKTTN